MHMCRIEPLWLERFLCRRVGRFVKFGKTTYAPVQADPLESGAWIIVEADPLKLVAAFW